MELEIDKFYEEDRDRRNVSSPLNVRTLTIALALHLLAFLLFWVAAKIMYRPQDVVIPIDMTIVPPWAEQDPDDPDPDPNPPPEEEDEPEPPKPKPPEPEPMPEPEQKVEAVEKIKEKPKKKEFKRGKVKMPEKKVEKPKKKEFKRSGIKRPSKIKPPVKLPPGKGTARDKPLSQADIMKALAAGARFGASNQLPENEVQRCCSLISRRFYECWTDFSWSEGLSPVIIKVRFGSGGRIVGYEIIQSSGDKKVDQSVIAAAKRAGRVAGLSADFLKNYPEVPIHMVPKRQ